MLNSVERVSLSLFSPLPVTLLSAKGASVSDPLAGILHKQEVGQSVGQSQGQTAHSELCSVTQHSVTLERQK